MSYHKETQSRYNQKIIQYKVKYSLHELEDGKRVQSYIEKKGMSANEFLKLAIRAYLDDVGAPYPDTLPADDLSL